MKNNLKDLWILILQRGPRWKKNYQKFGEILG
jgi:hypothetical protein